jgi:ABC-type transport system involved in cytochrome c biogenesis permease subunit
MKFELSVLSFLLFAQLILALNVLFMRRRETVSCWLWRGVALLALTSIGIRWYTVGYPPMRNVFEAFLWIPLILVGTTELTTWRAKYASMRLDAGVGALFLFPMIFVLSHAVKPLMPALQSPFFVPHILGYMVAYTLMVRAFLILFVTRRLASREASSASVVAGYQAANLSFVWGFFFLTLALALGSIWGNEVWGCYWQWDPKEQWSLATWLIYVAAFHFPRHHRGRLILLGVGILFILLTLTWSNVFPRWFEALGMPQAWIEFLFPTGMHAYV